jgi:hypothetical protein
MNDSNFFEYVKLGFGSFILNLIVLVVSLDHLFCLNLIATSCSDGSSWKNLISASLIFACMSNIIPKHWYGSMTLLIKSFVSAQRTPSFFAL